MSKGFWVVTGLVVGWYYLGSAEKAAIKEAVQGLGEMAVEEEAELSISPVVPPLLEGVDPYYQPFKELEDDEIPYYHLYSDDRLKIYAEKDFAWDSADKVDAIRRAYVQANRCYVRFLRERFDLDEVRVDDRNPVHVILVDLARLNGQDKIIPNDYRGVAQVVAVTRCTQLSFMNRSRQYRSAVFISGRVFEEKYALHEMFHIKICRTWNIEPLSYKFEEKLALEFENFDCGVWRPAE